MSTSFSYTLPILTVDGVHEINLILPTTHKVVKDLT